MAVLACHDRSATTRRALQGLFRQALPTGLKIEATLIDDGSRDDTVSMVTDEFPQVRLLRGDGTLWWAGAMTIALDAASRANPDFLLWLNDDVMLDRDCLLQLVSCHDAHTIAAGLDPVVIGATRDPDSGAHTYGGQRRDPLRRFRFVPVPPAQAAQQCDTFQGNIVLVPLAVHRQLGGIDPRFRGVQGMADTDFGLRATAHGIALIQAPGMPGTCSPNLRPAPWDDPALPVADRLKGLFGPRGFPPRGWFAFARSHGGVSWPIWAVSPYLRRLWPAIRPRLRAQADRAASDHRPTVALMDGLIPSYRLPVLAGMAQRTEWDVTVFHGPAPRNFRAVATTVSLPLKTKHVRHLTWPGGRRMAWTGGAGAALGGGYDIAVLEFSVHNIGTWMVWLARQTLGRPKIILSGHFAFGTRPSGLFGAVRHRLRLALAGGADALLPYTQRGQEACIAQGLDPVRIFVSHNTIDVGAARTAAIRVRPKQLAALREKLNLDPADHVFLFVGRIYADKRVELAIEAIGLLRRQGHRAVLLIVGDGPERQRLYRMADGDLGLRTLPPEEDEDRLAPLFALASAVVCPGAVGLIIAHGFAHGKPLVTCEGDAHGVEIDYLRPGENGLMTRAEPEPFAAALAALIDDPALLVRLSQQARETAEGMSIDKVVDGFVASWCHAIERPAPGQSR